MLPGADRIEQNTLQVFWSDVHLQEIWQSSLKKQDFQADCGFIKYNRKNSLRNKPEACGCGYTS